MVGEAEEKGWGGGEKEREDKVRGREMWGGKHCDSEGKGICEGQIEQCSGQLQPR